MASIHREVAVEVDSATLWNALRNVGDAAMDAPGVAYHHASMEVIDRGPGRCEFLWITDFFPPEASSNIAPLIEQGLTALKSNVESGR